MSLQPPYGILWNELKRGQIVAFLGAGASLSGRPSDAAWKALESPFPPKGSELARVLAEESSFPSDDQADMRDLAKVASFHQTMGGRSALRQRLRQIFNRSFQPGLIHEFLAAVEKPLLIVTTNYDSLIEQAFDQVKRPYHLVVHATDQKENAASVLWWKPGEQTPVAEAPIRLPLSLTDTTIIYKMHGTVDRQDERWDTFVITEEDYMDFLARMTTQAAIPRRFLLEFQRKRFLFLGYALGDWNLRVILYSLGSALPSANPMPGDSTTPPAQIIADLSQVEKGKSWSIQLQPSPLEEWLWSRRQVEIFDMRIEDFVAKMRKQMESQP